MIDHRAPSFALLWAVLAGAGCGDGVTVPSSLAVDATLAIDPLDGRWTGEIVLELEAPPGDEPVGLVLESVIVGDTPLTADDLEGLEAFPDELDAGERRRVVLRVDRPAPGDPSVPVGCGASAGDPPRSISVTVLDLAVAEAGAAADGNERITATVPVEPTVSSAPPVTVRSLWEGAEVTRMAVDPDGGDEVLIVTESGSTRSIASDGTVSAEGELSLQPLAVARGGGVDVVFGAVEAGDPRCPTDPTLRPSHLVAMRIRDGEIDWCVPLRESNVGLLAVDVEGVTTVVEGGVYEPEAQVRRIDAAGVTLGTVPAPVPLYQLVALPDGRVVAAGSDAVGAGVLAVFANGEEASSITVGPSIDELSLRPDGSLALRVGFEWWALDLDTGLREVIAEIAARQPFSFSAAELVGGDLLVAEGYSSTGIAPDYVAVAGVDLSLQRGGVIAWHGPVTCDDEVPGFLPTTGPNRFLSLLSYGVMAGPAGGLDVPPRSEVLVLEAPR